jgi:hypothetical protein
MKLSVIRRVILPNSYFLLMFLMTEAHGLSDGARKTCLTGTGLF